MDFNIHEIVFEENCLFETETDYDNFIDFFEWKYYGLPNTIPIPYIDCYKYYYCNCEANLHDKYMNDCYKHNIVPI